MKRSARCLLAVAPLFFSTLAGAKDLPNYNAFYAAKAAKSVASHTKAPAAFVASVDDRRGVPTFLWAARGASAGASGAGQLAPLTPESAARLHLAEHASRYGLSADALATAQVQQIHDLGRGGIIVVLRQAPGGIEVFHNDVKVLLDRKLELVAIGGNLHAHAVAQPKTHGFLVGETSALAAAFKDLHGLGVDAGTFLDTKQKKAHYHYYDLGASPALKGSDLRFVDPARIKRVYFPLPDRLVPAYFLELHTQRLGDVESNAYAYVIAADDGRLLYRENLTHREVFNYRVYADATGDHRPMDGPITDFCPHPTGVPDGSKPGFATPSLIAIDGFNKFKDPWLSAGATVTTGNNVDAYTDDDKPDGFSANDIRATTTSPNTFDRTYDTSAGPQSSNDQKMASIVDLFYVTNWLHDWWYDSGFVESAGNAQTNNYGRGGIGGDVLLAEAQDGAPQQRNNSNMSVFGDGGSPRMQMFVWDGISATTLGVQPLNQTLPNGVAEFGPQSFDLSGQVVLVNDGMAPVTDACQAITGNLAGKIALIDRGTCTFKSKAQRAQAAGAIGMILINNNAGEAPPYMPNAQGNGPINIPSMSITLEDGNAIKAALANGAVTVTMNRALSVDHDGTLDNSVIAHEWGHYIHLRQVACGSAACGAESEGWGDFFALHQAVREGDNLDAAYPLAQYATAAFPDDPNYFGIRRYPYSVDFSKNALTFKHITDGQDLPANVPVAQYNAQVNNAEAHAAGEIWTAMLFEAYVALLKKSQGANAPYTFDEARRRMGDYVEGGLKLAPVDPTYTEQRDAILAAAAAADVDDLQVLAQAFARRGAGTCAVSPARDSQDFSGVVESFTVQPNLAIVSLAVDDSVTSCDDDGHLDAEETGKVTVTVMNTGTASVDSATASVVSTAEGVTFPSGSKITFGALPPFGTATASVDIALAPTLLKMMNVDLKVALDGATGCAGDATLTTAPLANYDVLPMASTLDTVEAEDTTWKPQGDEGTSIWTRIEASPGNHVWAGSDHPSPSDTYLVSPQLVASATEKLVLSFDHRYSFETSDDIGWDGAVVEISAGNGWEDISKYGDPGYTGTIGDPQGQAQNALIDRPGYIGQSASWPSMDTQTIDLGTSVAGKTIRFRFRIGTDDASGDNGWEIDNIKVDGITNTPFSSLIDDKATCGAGPIANAGPDQMVLGGTQVTLDGSQSADPGGQPLGYEWKELSGQPVTITGGTTAKPTFTAPDVKSPTTLTFQLTVKNAKASGTDTVDIVVSPGMPSADAGVDGGPQVEAFGGCGCETKGNPSGTGAAASLLALAGLFIRRRRNGR
ncbi:Chitinase [Minicystis rosea]|nr:Chitinase [Minicystis rosea]